MESDQVCDERGSSDETIFDCSRPASESLPQVGPPRLVDKGHLTLDDPDVIAKLLPELTKLKILTGYKDANLPQEQQQPGQEIWDAIPVRASPCAC